MCQSGAMHDNQVGGDMSSGPPRSVDELARDPAWKLDRAASNGHWVIAEWAEEVGDRRWSIGLTPISAGVVAIIAWLDDVVVAHTRGDEAVICSIALRWIHEIRNGDIPE
jgi:hypothetical protein